jgi:hypothetical protein
VWRSSRRVHEQPRACFRTQLPLNRPNPHAIFMYGAPQEYKFSKSDQGCDQIQLLGPRIGVLLPNQTVGFSDHKPVVLSLHPLPGCVFVAEDLQHSWSNHRFPPFEKPFLRIWDCYSGSQPDNEDRMKSRASRQRLDTRESRKESLATHINHKI